MSYRLPPISSSATTGHFNTRPQRISLPPLSTWSDGFRVTSPFPSSPVHESSPGATPFTTRHNHYNPTVHSSPTLSMTFRPLHSSKVLDVESTLHHNEMPASQPQKPRTSNIFSLLDPIPPNCDVPIPEPIPRSHSEAPLKRHVRYSPSPSRPSLPTLAPVSNSPEDEQDSFISEFSTRSTYFRTSAERGQWKTDPVALRSHIGSFVAEVNRRRRTPVKISSPLPSLSPITPAHLTAENYQLTPSGHSDISSDLEDRDTPYSDVPQTLPSLSSDRDSSVDTYGYLSPLPPSSPLLSPDPQVSESLPPLDLAPASPTIPVSSPLSSIPSPLPADIDDADNTFELPEIDEAPLSHHGSMMSVDLPQDSVSRFGITPTRPPTNEYLSPSHKGHRVSVSSTSVHINNDAPDRIINDAIMPDALPAADSQGSSLIHNSHQHSTIATAVEHPTATPSIPTNEPPTSSSLPQLEHRALQPRPDNESIPLASAKPKAADEKCDTIASSAARVNTEGGITSYPESDPEVLPVTHPTKAGRKRRVEPVDDPEDVENQHSSMAPKKRKKDSSTTQTKARRRAKSRALSEALSDLPAKEEVAAASGDTPTNEPEICGLIIEGLATSRASSLPLSTLYRQIMQSRPAFHAQRSDKEWLTIFVKVLEHGEASSGVFGKVESSFKDDVDRPLDARWFYVPESDPDQERATLIRSMMPRPGKRSETKKYKQYYYRPLGKISRWDGEDEL